MEKVINISGINVPLKSTAGTPRRYKAQFKSDYFADLLKLAKTLDNGKGTGKNKNDEFSLNDFTWEALDRLNFDTVYNFVWALAKTANPQLPDPDTWFDTFDSFPIIEILPEITELLSSSIQSQKKVDDPASSSDELLTVESFSRICKDIGLSFEELDIMTIGDALDATQEFIDSRKPKEKVRRASQGDFDSF